MIYIVKQNFLLHLNYWYWDMNDSFSLVHYDITVIKVPFQIQTFCPLTKNTAMTRFVEMRDMRQTVEKGFTRLHSKCIVRI